MDSLSAASQACLLDGNILDLVHNMEVWYITALQQQQDASGAKPARGLLLTPHVLTTKMKDNTEDDKDTKSTMCAAN
jgi:hypothetical protein